MDSALRITLIANAGLLMTYRGTTLMVDGIYGREGHPFSNLSPEVWREMLGSEDRFQKVDTCSSPTPIRITFRRK